MPEDKENFTSDILDPFSLFIVVVFSLLALVFFIVGVMLLHTLKTTYSEFYNDYKAILWATTLLLTLPLLFRGIFDFLELAPKWSKFWNNRITIYNSIFFILTDYFPILS